jgi:hypothetical protein
MAAITRISHRHDAIIDFLLENPAAPLRLCAAHFGVTQPWLSTVIHSDLFQARYAERRETIEAQIAADIPTKLRAVADTALERLGEFLDRTEDEAFVLSAFDKVMHRLGYASAPPPAIAGQVGQQNVFMLDADTLQQLRARITSQGA